MKKIIVLCCALLTSLSAFAYYGYSSYRDEMSGFEIFTLLVMIAYIILSIILLIRWWKMTENVEKIRQHITHANPQLTYLVAIGEKEQAQKAALTMHVDALYPIYTDEYNYTKAASMNKIIQNLLPMIRRLGLTVPEYVTSGEKFIDYMNNLTGSSIQYDDSDPYEQQ